MRTTGPQDRPPRAAREGGLLGVLRPLAWLDVVAPWLRDTARSLSLGCLLALGGCGPSQARVEVEGVVRDGRTGEPIAGAVIATDDGRRVETDAAGRFAITVDEGDEELVAAAEDHERAAQTVRARRGRPARVSLHLPPIHDRVELLLRARCDDPSLDLRWAGRCAEDAPECARCHGGDPHLDAGPSARWLVDAGAGEAHLRADGCDGCHDGTAHDALGLRATAPVVGEAAALAGAHARCGSCHALDRVGSPARLRAFDRADAPIGGAPAEHLGAGAACVSCHRLDPRAEPDAAPRSAQAEVLLGRGARSVGALDDGAHRHVTHTCARCHMAPPPADRAVAVGGHTLRVAAADGAWSRSACAPCHGDVAPDRIGVRDWDGDGRARSIASEYRRALDRAERHLRGRIAALAIEDRCGGRAAGVRAHAERLHLVDARDRLIGDCDGDGALGGDERGATIADLPPELAGAAYDLALLRADGSSGVHNPAYAFAVLAGLR